jgi:hypothetical protein
MAHDVFISYSSKDKRIADAVCHALESNKIRCWYAPRDIPGGMAWDVAIMRAITESCVMVYVWTSNSQISKDVTREVKHAFREDVVLIPFRLEDIRAGEELKYYLADVQYLDALPPPFEDHLQRLVNHVQANLPGDGTVERQRGDEEQARKHTKEKPARERAEQKPVPATEEEAGKIAAGRAALLKATREAQLLAQHQAKARAEEEARRREAEDAARLRLENEKLERAIEELERERAAAEAASKHIDEEKHPQAAEDVKQTEGETQPQAAEAARRGPTLIPRFGRRETELPVAVANETERRRHTEARRYASVLVSALKLSNQQGVIEGRVHSDLYDRLRVQIDHSRKMYDEHVKSQVTAKYNYFHNELVQMLAVGDPSRLGETYPWSTALTQQKPITTYSAAREKSKLHPMRCPKCKLVFLDEGQKTCTFDGELLRPVLQESGLDLPRPSLKPAVPKRSHDILAVIVFFLTFGIWQVFLLDTSLAGLFSFSDSRIARGFFSFIGFVIAILLARFVHRIVKK